MKATARALLCAVLSCALAGCTGSPGAPGSAGGLGGTTGTGIGNSAAGAPTREEVQRRLALPRFTYVAETNLEVQGRKRTESGSLAVIDSVRDKVVARKAFGKDLSDVAVTPDGRYIYITDSNEPVVHMVDAETNGEVRRIALPGVRPGPSAWDVRTKYTFDQMEGCSSAIACTPDGKSVLVLSKAGLQVIDTTSGTVVRTLPGFQGGDTLAVSFDGKRAYAGTSDWFGRGARTVLGWTELALKGDGGILVMVDLETWQVAKKRSTGVCGGIAVRPDDTQVFYSDCEGEDVACGRPRTLQDIEVVDLKAGKEGPVLAVRASASFPTAARSTWCARATRSPGCPSADSFFCAVVENGDDGRSPSAYRSKPIDRSRSPSGRTARRRTWQAGPSRTRW